MFNNFFLPKIVPFMRYVEKYCRAGHVIDENMAHGFVYWIRKAKNTHSRYIRLIAFPLQQWLQERASKLRYTYTACLNFL